MQLPERQHHVHARATAGLAVLALAILVVGNAEARCLNRSNTSIPESTPTSGFIVHANGTLTDPKTRLMWKRCLEGQTLDGGLCQGAQAEFTWVEALDAAKASTFAGYDDWRLPNVKELFGIFEDRCAAPALNADLFPIDGLFGMWTSTPSAIYLNNFFADVWMIGFNASPEIISPNQTIKVLLVRDVP
jgi:hypothetical protein